MLSHDVIFVLKWTSTKNTSLCNIRTTKAQTILRIRAVLSAPLLFSVGRLTLCSIFTSLLICVHVADRLEPYLIVNLEDKVFFRAEAQIA